MLFAAPQKWFGPTLRNTRCFLVGYALGDIYRGIYRSAHSGHKILFFGSDNFSLPSLKVLYGNRRTAESSVRDLAVVTSFKEPENAVKKYATEHGLPVFNWPLTADKGTSVCPGFDIGVVVSFGYLIPEAIISSFPLGMINVHASLLPRWRGAAPIIYAILNGDRLTGVSIMKIRPKRFDIGELLAQQEVPISQDMLMPELHTILATKGADLLLGCVQNLPKSLHDARPQGENNVQYAPKVTPALTVIDWSTMSAQQVYDRYRALFSYKNIATEWLGVPVKLIDIRLGAVSHKDVPRQPGTIEYNRSEKYLRVWCSDRRCVIVNRLSVSGKRIMSAADFYNGFIQKLDTVGQRNACFSHVSI